MKSLKYKEPVKGCELEFKLIPINEIHIPPFQRDPSESLIKKLVLSMEKIGYIHPIIVYEDEGKTFVIDGQHRLIAAKELGVDMMPVIYIPKELVYNLMEFNTEKPPNVKEKSAQVYRLYRKFVEDKANIEESELSFYVDEPQYITFGFIIEEINKRFPASFFNNFIKKVDEFLSLKLEDAQEERRKRAKALYELYEKINEVYNRLGLTNALLKNEILRKAIQKVYGKNVRKIEDDYYTAIKKVKEALDSLTDEELVGIEDNINF